MPLNQIDTHLSTPVNVEPHHDRRSGGAVQYAYSSVTTAQYLTHGAPSHLPSRANQPGMMPSLPSSPIVHCDLQAVAPKPLSPRFKHALAETESAPAGYRALDVGINGLGTIRVAGREVGGRYQVDMEDGSTGRLSQCHARTAAGAPIYILGGLPGSADNAVAGTDLLGTLPVEIMQDFVLPELALSDRASLANTSRRNYALTWSNLQEALSFAGRVLVHDEAGVPVLGDDGAPLRLPPPVLNADGQPGIGPDGAIVRQQPLVLKQADYERALAYIGGLEPALQYAPLNALADTLLASPVVAYQPQFDAQQRSVTFPPHLAALMHSDSILMRDWAFERALGSPQGQDGWALNAIVNSLAAWPGFQPVPTVQAGTARRTANYPDRLEAMMYSRNPAIRRMGEVAATVWGDNQPRRIPLAVMEATNGIHAFTAHTDANNRVIEVVVPERYDTWLSPLPLDTQQRNVQLLLRKMRDAYPNDFGAIAAGFARYLNRTIGEWPPARVSQLLLSSTVFSVNNPLANAAQTFIHALRQPGADGLAIRASTVDDIATRIPTLIRNNWLDSSYALQQMAHLSVDVRDDIRSFTLSANQGNHDLTRMNLTALHDLGAQHPELNQEALAVYFGWVFANASRAPDGSGQQRRFGPQQ